MTALSNANTSWDGIESHSIGLTSFVLPKANSSDTGVSVRYAIFSIVLVSSLRDLWIVGKTQETVGFCIQRIVRLPKCCQGLHERQ